MKTKFILVRHGESLGNAKRIILGHTDWDLSDLGREQAEKTAAALADRKIDAVYSSDLKRAYNTVLPMATARGLEVITSKSLREMYIGLWEGQSVADTIEKWGELFTVEWREHFGVFRAPEGESAEEAASRFASELRRIALENEGKTVLIGTHAAVIRAFWGLINKVRPEELASTYPFPDNASYSEVEFEDGEFLPMRFSVSAHLSDMLTKIPF